MFRSKMIKRQIIFEKPSKALIVLKTNSFYKGQNIKVLFLMHNKIAFFGKNKNEKDNNNSFSPVVHITYIVFLSKDLDKNVSFYFKHVFFPANFFRCVKLSNSVCWDEEYINVELIKTVDSLLKKALLINYNNSESFRRIMSYELSEISKNKIKEIIKNNIIKEGESNNEAYRLIPLELEKNPLPLY